MVQLGDFYRQNMINATACTKNFANGVHLAFSIIYLKIQQNEILAIDSTFCKVHQHAAGARKIYGNQDIGRWQKLPRE